MKAVVLAGGAVNIIFGLLVYFILVSSSGNYISNIVDSILPNYSAQEAGIEQNDKILKINGKKIRLKIYNINNNLILNKLNIKNI